MVVGARCGSQQAVEIVPEAEPQNIEQGGQISEMKQDAAS
jgi:hypothetical protein